jgi:predicted nucleic acid-binding protein
MSAESIQILVSRICKYCDLVYINEDTINTALSYHEIYGYAYYDCLILASAVERGCEFIISEDMADGQVIEGVATIKNIFLTNKNKGKDS